MVVQLAAGPPDPGAVRVLPWNTVKADFVFDTGAERTVVSRALADTSVFIGLDAARYIKERDIAVVGADNAAVESNPFDHDEFLCVHKELVWRLGVRQFSAVGV